MDPYGPPLTEPLTPQEKQLMNEVIFLHYLWQQGPPATQFTHFPHPNPNIHPPANQLRRNLGSSTFPIVSAGQRSKRAKRNPHDQQQTGSGPEWPVDSQLLPPPPSDSPWPASKPNPAGENGEASNSDNDGAAAKLAAMQLQQKAAERFKEFLVRKRLDCDPGLDCGEEGEEGEPLGSASDVQESEEFKFLLSLFVEDHELRQLYEKNQENGELCCIVCGAMGVNARRAFKSCTTLVHHAMRLTKTKRQRSHRSFGHVIFRVFGWDLSKYPAIVVKDEPLGRSLQNLGANQGTQLSHVSDAQWPAWDPQTSSVKTANSTDEPAMLAEVQFMQRALVECKMFFMETSKSVSDGDDEESEDDNELDNKDVDELSFFMKLFTEDSELSNYYKSNHEGGDFCCLVCCAIGKKGWRRFKGCLGLLNHAVAISKTKKKKAHRAFGQVVCKVLGWNFDRLPMIVPCTECPQEESMATSSNLQCDPKNHAHFNSESFHDPDSKVEYVSARNGELTCELNSNSHQNQSIEMASKTCLVEGDATGNLGGGDSQDAQVSNPSVDHPSAN
ncbi:unnamed protein product [Linum trigynum]|uniref:Uncharacterized protein n=1 Tax=Linum trigynum TaxID=586398 RepID=A0AAV2ELU5_9ROSI